MTQSTTEESILTPELRSGFYYLLSMTNIGAATAYGGIWFAERGLSPDQIGLLNSVPVLTLLVINILVGKIADRASDWRQVIIWGACSSAIFALGLFFAYSFWQILLAWSLVNIAQGAVAPVMDAAASRITARRGTSFGALRAWGTVGFVLAVFATGYLAAYGGAGIFVPLIVGLCLVRALASLALPFFRSTEKTLVTEGLATQFSHMLKPWLLVPLLAWGMIQSTNMALMAFQALLWKQQGLSESLIGNLIALGAIAETALMFAFPLLKGRFRARQLMLIAALVAAFRWACFAFSPGMPWLIPLQLLHAFTYALGYLGVISFITRWTAEDMAAEAQGVLVVIQQLAVVVMMTLFGHLVAGYGAGAFFASMAMAGAGALLIIISILWLNPPGAAREA